MTHSFMSLFTTTSPADPPAPGQPAVPSQHVPATVKHSVMQLVDPKTRLAVFRTCKHSWQWVLEDAPSMSVTVQLDSPTANPNLVQLKLQGVRAALAARGARPTKLVLQQAGSEQVGLCFAARKLLDVAQHVQHLTVQAPVVSQQTVKAMRQAFPRLHTLQLSLSEEQAYVAALQHMASAGWSVPHLWMDTRLTDTLLGLLLTNMPALNQLTLAGIRETFSSLHSQRTWQLQRLYLSLPCEYPLRVFTHLPRPTVAGGTVTVQLAEASILNMPEGTLIDPLELAHVRFLGQRTLRVSLGDQEVPVDRQDQDLAAILPVLAVLAHPECVLQTWCYWLSPGLLEWLHQVPGYKSLRVHTHDLEYTHHLSPALPPLDCLGLAFGDEPIGLGWALQNLASVKEVYCCLNLNSDEHSRSPWPWERLVLSSTHELGQLLDLPDASHRETPVALEFHADLYYTVKSLQETEVLVEQLLVKLKNVDVFMTFCFFIDTAGDLPREDRVPAIQALSRLGAVMTLSQSASVNISGGWSKSLEWEDMSALLPETWKLSLAYD